MSDSIRSSNEGEAQEQAPDGAGTAPATEAATETNVRWVGEQRLMAGYCGRAVDPGQGRGQGAAATVRPARQPSLLERQRNAVVRIGPRARADADATGGAAGGYGATGGNETPPGEARPRAA